MHRAKNQAGLTAVGLILILIPVGLAVYIILKAAPAYIEAFSVGDVVNSLKKELDLKEKSREEIYTMLDCCVLGDERQPVTGRDPNFPVGI
jgi:hypothetical protein